MRELPGIRVFYKMDWRAILTVTGLVLWALALQWILVSVRPDLSNPTQIGTDTSNYYAAGQRLNDGHQLYQLQAGDRPVANGIQADPWSYPLLSPPSIAVLWRILALLPGNLAMYLWWLTGGIASIGFVTWLLFRCRAGLYPGLLILLPLMAITAVSGNVNAMLIPACAVVWRATKRGRPGIAGSVLGIAVVLKLTPGLWIWWFIIRRDVRALAACLATIAIATVVTAVGASPVSFAQYIAVAHEAASVALPSFSPVALASQAGLPMAVAELLPYSLAAAAAALAWRWRSRPSWAFAACAVGVTIGTPDLRLEGLGWLLLALVPFANDPAPRSWRRLRAGLTRKITGPANLSRSRSEKAQATDIPPCWADPASTQRGDRLFAIRQMTVATRVRLPTFGF